MAAVTPSLFGISDGEKPAMRPYVLKAAATDFWHDFSHANIQKALETLGKSYCITSS